MLEKVKRLRSPVLLIFLSVVFYACPFGKKTLVIWTNRPEFASYVDLFNASQERVKAVAVYKRFPAQSFPPPKGETVPGILVASGLKGQKTRARFLPLDSLFAVKRIDKEGFYENLLDYGTIGGKTYLLPVSFNLPAVIFDSANEGLVPDEHLLSLEQLRETAALFNAKKNQMWSAMGFAPSWDPFFLYLTAQLFETHFRTEDGSALAWNDDALRDAILFMRDWTETVNSSSDTEKDFAFKYLYTPPYRRIFSGKCLFAFVSSGSLFMIPDGIKENVGFRWLHKNLTIPVDDECVYFAINRKSDNTGAAKIFAEWFFQEKTQRILLERSASMRLNTTTFGIAGGFSGMRRVTENVFPATYPSLLGNIPSAEYLSAPDVLPPAWFDIRQQVVFPYLIAATDTRGGTKKTLNERFSEWTMRERPLF
jgi:ABC-type glycerol-3-phosphate transport system substrate-binding protein